MEGTIGNELQSNVYARKWAIKIPGESGNLSPKNIKNTQQIITEGREKKPGIEESPSTSEELEMESQHREGNS